MSPVEPSSLATPSLATPSLATLPVLLDHLGVEDQDRGPITELVDQVHRDADLLAEVHRLTALLTPYIGQWQDTWERPGFLLSDERDEVMAGGLPLCALLATASQVHAHHLARGISDDVSWASLADLGQQVTKHRLVRGATGLTQTNWLRNVWAGDFIRLGRLQFELYTTDLGDGPELVLNTHIPGDGPMSPAAVGQSLAAAPGFYVEHYADQLGAGGGIDWLYCQSWLLDPVLDEVLPGSNIAAFSKLWQVIGGVQRDRDAYYFVFDIEPDPARELPDGLDELPQRTSLERALVSHWRAGNHLVQARGRIAAR